MAAALYTTDLTLLTNAESGTWGEFASYAAGGSPAAEATFYIEGAGCYSQTFGTKTGLVFSIVFDYGSDLSASFTTGICFFMWHICLSPTATDTYANGGARCGIGADLTDVDTWFVGGNDYKRNPYGGWHNIVIDPTHTVDIITGAGNGGVYRWFGSILKTTAQISKGAPHGVDRLSYGRGELKIEHGDLSNGYGTFPGIATENDTQTKRWGLFQAEGTGYLWKGLQSFGNSTNSCDFRDSNRSITIDDTPKTYAAFNRIEIKNAGSRVDWTRVNITALNESGLSCGQFEMVDNATVNWTDCVFTGMSTFIFDTNFTGVGCVWLRCGQITHVGADFDSCAFDGYEGTIDTSYLKYNVAGDPDGKLDNCNFKKGTAATHAIEFGVSSPTTMTLRNIDFNSYNASHGQNDSTLRFLRTSGTITVNLIGCSGNISYKKEAGATVNLVQNPVTMTITVKDINEQTVIQGARVLVWVKNSTNYPYQASVTIAGTGTTATVTHSLHGLATNDNVIIEEVNEDVYNGAYQITVTGTNTYTYTTSETITVSPATGTPISTFAVINNDTNVSGVVSDSRTYPSGDQLIQGRVRKASSSPYYKQQPINETIDNSDGLSVTVQLIPDE